MCLKMKMQIARMLFYVLCVCVCVCVRWSFSYVFVVRYAKFRRAEIKSNLVITKSYIATSTSTGFWVPGAVPGDLGSGGTSKKNFNPFLFPAEARNIYPQQHTFSAITTKNNTTPKQQHTISYHLPN